MLETRFKVALWLAVLFMTTLPVMGILRGTKLTPFEQQEPSSTMESGEPSSNADPRAEEMVTIAAGPFTAGTNSGGFDEGPEHLVYLDTFMIDRYEITNAQYLSFVTATNHRYPGPPSRYAKNMAKMRGSTQPVVYVSWDDANAYCAWKGLRLPTEAEWEKAMRGTDGRLWPWGGSSDVSGANWARVDDGFDVTAPVGAFQRDMSPFGVADGAGNVIEWVADWYGEDTYRNAHERNPTGPEYGTFKVLRGGGYASTGSDIRITSRSKMVPDFRDETIGFRCASSGGVGLGERGRAEGQKL
jgi:formylglycine-generating enzyme